MQVKYCDLRVDYINDEIIDEFVELGYTLIAVNTTVNCSQMGLVSSNRKGKKINVCYDEDNDWIPIPKSRNIDDNSKLAILNRLTIQITNIGQLKQIINSQNFSKYNILAVEPLDDRIIKDLVTFPSVDIIICKTNTMITGNDYSIAVDKQIYFELSYASMLMDSNIRQKILTLANLFHSRGKSKNIILTSGTLNKHDIRSPHDVMNLGFILGLNTMQSKESITCLCHSIILKSYYGRKLGKSGIYLMNMKNAESQVEVTKKIV